MKVSEMNPIQRWTMDRDRLERQVARTSREAETAAREAHNYRARAAGKLWNMIEYPETPTRDDTALLFMAIGAARVAWDTYRDALSRHSEAVQAYNAHLTTQPKEETNHAESV